MGVGFEVVMLHTISSMLSWLPCDDSRCELSVFLLVYVLSVMILNHDGC